ncbi:MAG TPA: chromate efflux transporter, partial [Fimbriimonadaceae bacterium]|nr:chromate efflux transporter [Fimbriimonadaceae bacterium]
MVDVGFGEGTELHLDSSLRDRGTGRAVKSIDIESDHKSNARIWAELAAINLRLGLTAFGGPAAHVAMMHREFVEQREWLTNEEFTELFGMVNLIPGPNSTELAMQIGRVRGGGVGLVVAGACFIVPAALLVTAFAVAYRTWGHAPAAEHLLYGIKPVIVAIVAQAVVTLLRTTVKSVGLGVIGAAAVLAAVFGLHPLAAVAASGLAAMAPGLWRDARPLRIRPLAFLLGLVAMLVTLAFGLSLLAPASRAGVAPIFLYFLKIGSVLYGSGYVLLAYLNVDLVSKLGWLTKSELLDAVAVGQFTPGPVFTTATFIGYLVAGPWGAVV